jgi:hypothetical protein
LTIPSSIQRIQPLPDLAVTLLNRLPLSAADLPGLRDSFPPDLLEAIRRAAVEAQLSGTGLEQLAPPAFAEIAITILIRNYMTQAFTFSGDRRYWRYTLACAVCCAELAPASDAHAPLAYSAGLLHDIGRLAVIAAYPEKYSNLLTLADRMFEIEQPFDMLEHERMLFGLDHFAAGAWLASTWKLPSWLLAVTGKFDDRTSGEHRSLVATVRAGTRLAHSLGFGYLANAPRAAIRTILGQLPSAWEHWQVLDKWQFAEEHISHKIQTRLQLYAAGSETELA